MTDLSLFRVYEPHECGSDGYPKVWHDARGWSDEGLHVSDRYGVKDLVRQESDHRCARCSHHFVVRQSGGEWSPCDERCTHQGPFRFRYGDGEWTLVPAPPTGDLTLTPDGYLHLLNGATVQAAWRVLTVHHLNGRKFDLRWWNLAALCQRCHLVIQGKVQMERVYPYEHSEWFKPYAAGYYALCYEGRDITREEAEQRLSDLLTYERMV